MQSFDPSIGRVHVLYPHADADRCTAGLLLAADAVGFVRGESPDRGFLLGRSSNDRPSAAPSFPGRGFAGDGRANTVGVFDPKALAPVAAVATGKNPDAVPYDPATKRVFAFDGATATAIGGVTAESRRVRGGRTTAAR